MTHNPITFEKRTMLGLLGASLLLAGDGPYAADTDQTQISDKGMAGTAVSLETLLDEMADRSALSKLSHPAYVAKAATSYDRASKVNNPADGLYVETNGRDWGKGWFANRDFGHCIRREENAGRTESVIMEDEGPGAIVRWWAPACEKGMIRVYLDGAATPVLEMKPDDLVGSDKLVSYPLSFLASDDTTRPEWRGRNLYLPIPYQKSCKVTWEGDVWYYQIHYRRYAEGTRVRTFSLDQLASAKETLQQVVARLTTGSTTVDGRAVGRADIVLAPEESTTLAVNSPGAITKLLVQLSAGDYRQALRSTVVTMTFDGEQTAWIPVGSLGGVGYSSEKNETFYVKTDAETGTVCSYYAMPFRESADITLTNCGSQDVIIKQFQLTVDDYQWDESSLYFHATWFELRNISTRVRRDLNYVTVKGTGRYVGTSITVFNTDPRPGDVTWWGEGDEKVYVDGEAFPSIFGTGSEDYFNYAWCRPQRFWNPFGSQPRGEGNKKAGYSNNNRHHLLDDIPFCESLRFDMELWHATRENMNYAAATFFYARPGASCNREASPESVRHKVALERDDVLQVTDEPHHHPVQVYILAGQSNAVGYNDLKEYRNGKEAFPESLREQIDVLFWDADASSGEWTSLRVRESGGFGPEIGFAAQMSSDRPGQKIAIIKCAVGGTGIARSTEYRDYIPGYEEFDDQGDHWHPPTEGGAVGLRYQHLVETICKALIAFENDHVNWELAGFIWMQGEHEAGLSPTMAGRYGELLESFMAAVRRDCSSPGLPFVIGEVNGHDWPFAEIVRREQARVCESDPRAILVKTADLSRKGSGGGAHFDADGMLALGMRIAGELLRRSR